MLKTLKKREPLLMALLRNPTACRYGFYLANFFLIVIIYHRFPHPIHFAFVAGGLLLFSYFAQRAINQLIGNE